MARRKDFDETTISQNLAKIGVISVFKPTMKPPSIDENAFDCPHCGAFTSQHWFSTFADAFDDGKTPHFPSESLIKNFQNNEEIPEGQRAEVIKWARQMRAREVFAEYASWKNLNAKLYNLNVSKCYVCQKFSVWVADRVVFPNASMVPKGKAFPDYIPAPIREDYGEACEIKEASPKASATLSRRCLQGMIRDFWGVTAPTLKQEIDTIRTKVDPLTWQAIESVRQVGNIGAHMEKDVNVVVDIEPNEAGLLIGLIETLMRDWYVNREERKKQLEAIHSMAAQKQSARKAGATSPKP